MPAIVACRPRFTLQRLVAGALTVAVSLAALAVSALANPALRQAHRRSGGTHCADSNLRPSATNIALVEKATLCLINQRRRFHGERGLRASPDLGSAAQGHSLDMVNADYFGHTSPGGKTLLDRVRASGYLRHEYVYELAENIAIGTSSLSTPAAIVSGWMHSPGHRANILDSDFVDSGIGIAAAAPSRYSDGQPGATYTQDFGVVLRYRHR